MGSLELVGRDAEAAALRAALAGSRPVVLLGESGIGKTTLIETVLAQDGRLVRRGGGLATLSWMPYLAVARAVGRTSFDVDEAAAVADLVEQEVGADVLFIDDLHACDAGSLEVVSLLASRATVVAAVRLGHEGTDRALNVSDAAGFERLALMPLGDGDSRALVRDRAPAASPDRVERVVRVSGGVPLLLEELAGGSSEASLARTLRSRLAPLDDDAHDAALLLAVAGRPVADDLPAFDSLVSARVAERPEPGLVQVRHALLASALLDGVPQGTLREVHRRLSERAVNPLVRAFHLLEAGDAVASRDQALLGVALADTPGRRADALLLAARASSAAGPDVDLLVRTAAELVDAGRGAEALDVLRRIPVDAAGGPAVSGRVCALRAQAAWMNADLAEFEAALAEADSLESSVPAEVLVDLRYQRATYALFISPDAEEKERACAALLEAADSAGTGRGRAAMREAVRHLMHGDYRAIDELEEALQLCREEGDLGGELVTANNLVDCLTTAAQLQDAYELALRQADRAARLGLADWALQFRAMAATSVSYLGLPSEALRLSDEVMARATDPRSRLQARGVRLHQLVELGDSDRVLAELGDVRRDAEAAGEAMATAAFLEAQALWQLGRLEEAAAAARHDDLAVRPEFIEMVQGVRDWIDVELGREPTLLDVTIASPVLRHGADLENRGCAAFLADDHAGAASAFDAAAEVWARRWRFVELRCRWAAAESRRRAGGDVREELLALEARIADIGYQPLLQRVQRSLRLAGIARASERRVDRAGLLSAREEQILRLAADGLADAEIARALGLGVPTVRRHVGNAVVKLGVTTRVAAVAALSSVDGVAS